VSRTCILFFPGLTETDTFHTRPIISYISCCAPAVSANFSAPFPHITHSILAQAVYNVAICLIKSFAHNLIRLFLFREAVIFGNSFIIPPILF